MGQIGDIEIGDQYCSGGAFELTDAPKSSDYNGDWEEISPLEVSDGWKVFLKSETAYVVAQTEQDIPKDEVLKRSLDAAISGLDIFSIVSDYYGQTSNSRDDYVLWWVGSNGRSNIELVGTASLETRARARITVDGERQLPTIPEWNESFRYFRLSLLTDDIFDAYRNQFLAVEYFLSYICPPQRDERLTDWIERALEEAHARYNISNYARNEDNPVASIHGYQYEYIRCGMFHSQATGEPGATNNRLTPRSQSDIATVEDALIDLTEMYSHMVGQEFGNSPNSPGGMTFTGFDIAMESLLSDGENEIILTPEIIDTDSGFQVPENAEVLDATISEDYEAQGVKYVEAAAEIRDLDMTTFRQSILISRDSEESNPLISGNYENKINVLGFDNLNIIKGTRLVTSWRSLS